MDKKNDFSFRFLHDEIEKSAENNLKHLDKLRRNRENFIAGMNWFYEGKKLDDSDLFENISFRRGYENAEKIAINNSLDDENHKTR